MVAAPEPRRAALYLDLDNVFSSLARLDREAAWRFATEPGRWLAWLTAGMDGGGPRRLLLRRCYLNPEGMPGLDATLPAQPRLTYGQHRGHFVQAGFQVVDCPRLAQMKNGADMVMALDMLDALALPARVEEFLILSGDTDFTPLLHRLRAHDRLSLVVAQPVPQALKAAADRVLPLADLAAKALASPKAPAPPKPAVSAATPGTAKPAGPPMPAKATVRAAAASSPRPAPMGGTVEALADPGDNDARRDLLLSVLRRELQAADHGLRLGTLGQCLRRRCGDWVESSRLGGAGKLSNLVEGCVDLVIDPGPSGGWLYDPSRHTRPSLGHQPSPAEKPPA
jgi:hypothetical protein